MAFLNKKEDVIDFQLTQYGKYLVSQGKFKPTYYAFYDDNIIYDQMYATGSAKEVQKDIEKRILEDTPSLEAQYLFHSVDNLEMSDQFSKNNEMGSGQRIQQTPEKHYALSNPLANCELASNKAPAFEVNFYKGEINKVNTTTSGSVGELLSVQQIPQINLKPVIFFISVKNNNKNPSLERFSDGSYLKVQDDYILLEIEEQNAPINKENYDLEVYVVDKNNKIEHPLYFEKSNEMVVDGILLDEDEVATTANFVPNVDDVGYYFDMLFDDMASFFIEDSELPQGSQSQSSRDRSGSDGSGY